MFSRRLLIIPLALVLAIQFLIPAPSFAVLGKPSPSGPEEAAISLEQAIQIVKKHFEISPDFKDFTSGFNHDSSRQFWSLNWSSEADYGSFMAQVDAESGEILSIYMSKPYQPNAAYKIPAISLEQAKQAAQQYLNKLAGNKTQSLKLDEDNSLIPLNIYGQTDYSFRWQRTENGIPVKGDGVSIQIDGETGKLLSYNLNWNRINFPKPANVIDVNKAKEAFSQANLLDLQYFLTPVVKPLIADVNGKEQVQLVYQLKNNGTIDALTGKPLNLNQDYWLAGRDKMANGLGAAQEDSAGISLTPQERQEIADTAKLLSKEQAIEAVKKGIDIPSNLSLKSMNLYKDAGIRGSRVWSFRWESSDHLQSLEARVNAENGDLLGFGIYDSASTPPKGTDEKISKEQAQKIAEGFLRKIQAAKFSQSKLNSDALPQDAPLADTISARLPAVPDDGITSLTFNYQRVVNGILFPSNQINVTVDLLTQKITSYYLTWWDLDFPKPSEAKDKNSALQLFFQDRPMELQYVIVYEGGEAKEARLVYQPASGNLTSDLLDAVNGEFLDWQGKPLSDRLQRLSFTDIAGDPAEREIAALGLAGLFGEYGKLFKPQDDLAVSSLLQAMLAIRNGTVDRSQSPGSIIKEAKKLGWVREELSPAQTVNRELFSKILIRYVGLEKIANLTDIYTSDFSDAAGFAADSRGYIALATGLGIIPKPADGKFSPNQTVSRSEAAYSLVKALEFGFRY